MSSITSTPGTATPPIPLASLLTTWRPVPATLLELRALHAQALNTAVAQRCRQADAASTIDVQAAARSTWTSPELAFSHYVALAAPQPSPEQIEAALDALAQVAGQPCPPTALDGPSLDHEWARFGVQTLVGDYDRDGRAATIDAARPRSSDVDACAGALEILGTTWPEMAQTIDALVREVLWYDTVGGPRSGTLLQAFGAVFLARGMTVSRALEDLVHEATHLEVIARVAIDKVLANPQDLDVSPYRQQPRPLSRVLHVAMVATRGAEAMRRGLELLPATERDAGVAAQHQFEASRDAALASLERSARFTPAGERLWADLTAR